MEAEDWYSEFINGSIVCWGDTWSAAKTTNERFSTARYNIVSRQNSHLNRGGANQASGNSKVSLSVSTIAEVDETVNSSYTPVAQPKPMPRVRDLNLKHTSMRSNTSDNFEL